MGLPVVAVGLLWRDYSGVERVDLSSALSARGTRSGTNTLIVGTDSREGITGAEPNAAAFITGSVTGSRADTIIVLHTTGSTNTLVSIPRDLWVTDPASGEKGRINSTYADGPSDLVRAVTGLGIPVDRYMEIDFGGFGDLVDAVGGVTIDVPVPIRDTHSGLEILHPGPHRLDGTEALAYVRSRYFEQLLDGSWRMDGTADLGRTERQRMLLTGVLRTMVSTRSPIRVLRVGSALSHGVRLDSSTGLLDLLELARSLSSGEMTSENLPVTPRRTSGGAEVLELTTSSGAVLGRLTT